MEQLKQSGRGGWQFWIDRGGTFTDVLGVSPGGQLHVRKVPSVAGGAVRRSRAAARCSAILAAAGGGTAAAIDIVKVGTTVATNALLTRSGEPVVLVTTAGFADGLRIGYQNRPDIFARHIVLPQALYGEVIEARERIDARGAVLTALDLDQLRADLERARAARPARGGDRVPACMGPSAARAPGRPVRARAGLCGSLGLARAVAAGPLRHARRHHRAQCLPRAAARGLRAAACRRSCARSTPRARLALMQSNGGLADPESFLPHVERAVRSCGRAHRHAVGGAPAEPAAADRL